ncbi:MAG TPA: ABC transporter permease [Candidatus Dormibacteraeota bacterium]|jgi:lipooligosaccharide transport system permease protein|nr:ABC transporter permease [Candidatus Dormibacteraeota bacterium]
MPLALRLVQHDFWLFRRSWQSSLASIIGPFFYLSAMGIGLGTLVDRQSGGVDGVSYIVFLAPGLMAAAAMQSAVSNNAWPIMGKIRWNHTYYALLATPIGIDQLVAGEVIWAAVRLVQINVCFLIAMVVFRAVPSWWGLLSIPAATLTGLAFATPMIAISALLRNDGGFTLVFRLVVTPLFLFGGAFFPISRLPRLLQIVAWGTPLFHGVSLTRGLVLGNLSPGIGAINVAVLLAFTAAGLIAARWAFRRKLMQ